VKDDRIIYMSGFNCGSWVANAVASDSDIVAPLVAATTLASAHLSAGPNRQCYVESCRLTSYR
jgi:hypothetical protein